MLKTITLLSCVSLLSFLMLADINEVEPNNSYTDSGTLTVGVNNNLLGTPGDSDYWLLQSGVSGPLYVYLTGSNGNIDCNFVGRSDGYNSGTYHENVFISTDENFSVTLEADKYYSFKIQQAPFRPDSDPVESRNAPVSFYNLYISDSPLPIELYKFKTEQKGDIVKLYWQTQSESNNSHFEIEHSPNGTADFYPFGKVEGAGTTLEKQDYHFTHQNPMPGTNYYRLRQVDYDGKFKFSKIVSVEVRGEMPFHFYPNPAGEELILMLDAKDETYFVRIFDLHGKALLQHTLDAPSLTQHVDVDGLPPGVFLMEITAGRNRWHARFIKK